MYKYAEDSSGKIINIDTAVTGANYFCPQCKDKFIFKNGKIRQRHFAHANPSANCSGEGYLHKTFKKMLVEKIKEHINRNIPLIAFLKCNVCHNSHDYNLLDGINDVRDEYVMDGCRPDIALIHEKGHVPIIIEIVVTHEPEDNVIEYCRKHRTCLIKIKLDALIDLENIEHKIKYPTKRIVFYTMHCPIFVSPINMQNQYFSPNTRIVRGGPKIEQIEAAQKGKKQYGKNYYNNRREKRK